MVGPSFSCLRKCRSRLVCWPKQRSHRWHLYGFSLLWMFLTCRCRFDEIENERSQNWHLYGCSPVCVRRWRVRFADRGNVLPQYLQPYRSLFGLPAEVADAPMPPWPGGLAPLTWLPCVPSIAFNVFSTGRSRLG